MTPDPFLRAILAAPDDDLLRLIYADALDAGDSPGVPRDPERAEFIRVQCEIARLLAINGRWVNTPSNRPAGRAEDGGPAGAALATAQILEDREAELLEFNWLSWSGLRQSGFLLGRPWRERIAFRRGFVAEITCTAADFLAHAAAVFQAQPVGRVTLTAKRPMRDPFSDPGYRTFYGMCWPWRWHSQGEPDYDHSVPPRIFGQLDGSGRWKNTYPTEAQALADLSAACVRFGRKQAELPAWEPDEKAGSVSIPGPKSAVR